MFIWTILPNLIWVYTFNDSNRPASPLSSPWWRMGLGPGTLRSRVGARILFFFVILNMFYMTNKSHQTISIFFCCIWTIRSGRPCAGLLRPRRRFALYREPFQWRKDSKSSWMDDLSSSWPRHHPANNSGLLFVGRCPRLMCLLGAGPSWPCWISKLMLIPQAWRLLAAAAEPTLNTYYDKSQLRVLQVCARRLKVNSSVFNIWLQPPGGLRVRLPGWRDSNDS